MQNKLRHVNSAKIQQQNTSVSKIHLLLCGIRPYAFVAGFQNNKSSIKLLYSELFFTEFQQQKLLSFVKYESVEFRRERAQIGEQPWLIG